MQRNEMGALVGYDFGSVNRQAYVTRDVVQHDCGGYDTLGALRATMPIYQDADAAPVRPLFSRWGSIDRA